MHQHTRQTRLLWLAVPGTPDAGPSEASFSEEDSSETRLSLRRLPLGKLGHKRHHSRRTDIYDLHRLTSWSEKPIRVAWGAHCAVHHDKARRASSMALSSKPRMWAGGSPSLRFPPQAHSRPVPPPVPPCPRSTRNRGHIAVFYWVVPIIEQSGEGLTCTASHSMASKAMASSSSSRASRSSIWLRLACCKPSGHVLCQPMRHYHVSREDWGRKRAGGRKKGGRTDLNVNVPAQEVVGPGDLSRNP
jgi:hypothetical protein